MKINGKTLMYGFFGETFEKSMTYAMYNTAFQTLGLNCVYVPFVVNNLKKAVEGIRHLGIKGVGITIPYKISIIKYLDCLDKNAKRIGAVNVVINNNGKLIGGNTDGEGAVMALKEKTGIKGKKVILLGAGGVARAIAHAIKDAGGKLVILNRTVTQARRLSLIFNTEYGSLNQLENFVKDADILINATSVGMDPLINNSLVDPKLMHRKLVVQEVIVNPKETKLIKDAKKADCTTVTGDLTLFWQAVLKFKLFTGFEAPVKIMEQALFNNINIKG